MLPKIGSRSNTQASPAVSREPSNVDNTQQGKKTLKLPSINKTVSVQDPPSRQPTQTDIPAANIFQALSNQNTDLSSLKPKKRDNTLEGLKKIADKLRPKKEQKKKLWPGDPAAVGSIRRPRKTAQEMASMLTAATKVLQTNRELLALQTCTKNCQRKYQVDETLLPKEAPPTLSSIMKKYREMNRPPRKAKSMGDLPNLSDSTVSLAASEPALTKGKLELSKGFFASITKKEPGSNLLTVPKDQPQGQVTEGQGQVQKNDLNPRPVLPSIQETPAKKPAAAGGLMAMLKNMKAANAASGAAPIEVQ
ncbi:uncharacterized protein LOC106157604 [Lingula anatina]|uniref:Uncharacterized protein LOC106156866 n=1 Tax=Lingula anatina TaxID=7574 RepID=A0A1S3HRV1_LINAN|nr:uncharacterized protein LOC106156866 [Lingula anatina]XP_013388767.1 uncharacterized protein LOC106157604 [Lingula anatina]|eukprot:XP_013387751.1 uncharacterized protein LOC106156866 [Lingula anatina]